MLYAVAMGQIIKHFDDIAPTSLVAGVRWFRQNVSRRDERPARLHPESQLAGTVSGERGVHVAHHTGPRAPYPRRYTGDLYRRRGQVSRLARHAQVW